MGHEPKEMTVMKKTTRKTKSSTTTDTRQAVEITFEAPRAGAPDNLLANATRAFHTGLLAGLWMPGFALWRAERATSGEQFISVTVPSKKVEGTYYDWLRGNQKKLKAVIVSEYERWTSGGQAAHAVQQDAPEREPWSRSPEWVSGAPPWRPRSTSREDSTTVHEEPDASLQHPRLSYLPGPRARREARRASPGRHSRERGARDRRLPR